jgi:hypothetical protein
MNRDFEGEKLVENSTISMLRAMSESKPEDFLRLLEMNNFGTAVDQETTDRFKRLGLLDPAGNIQESVRDALGRVKFTFEE